MKLQEFVVQSSELVNELSEAIENQQIGLKEVEERILVFVNKIGDLMVQKVVEKVGDPLTENRVWVEEQEAVFDQVRNMRFRNRFGWVTERTRRCYKYLHRTGGYYPLDELLGVEKCRGFSPFLTFLQVLFGATRPFEESGELLSKALGFSISSTAVQSNTEHAGNQLDDNPYRANDESWRAKECEELIVQMDWRPIGRYVWIIFLQPCRFWTFTMPASISVSSAGFTGMPTKENSVTAVGGRCCWTERFCR